jgi:hypothetical protein
MGRAIRISGKKKSNVIFQYFAALLKFMHIIVLKVNISLSKSDLFMKIKNEEVKISNSD